MSTPEPHPYRQLNYPINNLEQSFSQEQKLQTRANIGIPSSVNNTDKVLTVDDAAGELAWKEVEIPEVPVQDVEVDGVSVVNENGVAEITMPTIPVTDVTVNGTSVVSNTVAAVTVPTAVSDLQNDVGYITSADVPSAQTQSDWDESDSSDPSFIQNKPTPKQLVAGSNISISESLSTVTISAAEQVNADWDAASGKAQILHKPDLSVYATTQAMNTALAGKQDTISDLSAIRSGAQAGATAVQPSDLATVATTGDYDDLTDKPDLSIYAESSDLATVATTGSYNDLSDKPSIPPAQVNADWDATSGVAAILNKPNLATVATTGDYSDLVNTPSIPAAQVNSDWSETDSSSKAYIENKPDLSVYAQSSDLATVATTGSYDDLSDKPVIPAAQIQSDWTESDSTSKAYIQHKPDLSIYAQSANLATVATTGDYADLDNTPSLATVATTGDYSDLTNKPSIPAAQVNSDWDAQSGVAQILNKPNLATVATSGNYNDLSNKPTIPPAVTVDQHYDALSENPQSGTAVAEAIAGTGQVPTVGSSDDNKVLMASFSGGVGSYSWEPSAAATQVNADWDATSGVAKILNKPDLSVYAESSDLAAVATSGDYNDLQNRPSIPAAQVNADWDANSGVAQILNKPNLATVATTGDYSDLQNKPTIPAAQVQSNWNESDSTSKAYIQNKPDLSVYAQSANLATVATTGDYDDLENKPVIPAAQIQADWNETNTSSKAYIQNKPTIPAAVTVDQTYNASSTNPQSGTAVAGAISGIRQVPEIYNGDTGLALVADYNSGNPMAYWDKPNSIYVLDASNIDLTAVLDMIMVFEKNTVLLKVAETPVASDSREMYLPLVDIEYGMSTTDTVAYFTGVLDSNLYTYKLYYDTNDDDWALDSTVTPVSGGGSSYTAGVGIDITSGVISADIDGVTIKQATTQSTLQSENDIIRSPSGGYGVIRLNSDVKSKLTMDPDFRSQRITIHIPGNTFRRTSSGDITSYFNIYLEIADKTLEFGSETKSSLYPTPLEMEYNSTDGYTYLAEQDVVVSCFMGYWVNRGGMDPAIGTGGPYYFGFAESQNPQVSSQLFVTANGEDWITDPVVMSETVATNEIAVAVPVPSPTVSDTGKALIAGAKGPVWSQVDYSDVANTPTLATVATSGSYADLSNKPSIPTVSNTYSSSSTNAMSGIAVASAVANKQNKLYSINDVRVVSSLPASPVSTTLYLIPET